MALFDIILFAVIAAFLGYRLWSILGTHDADKPIRKRQSKDDELVVPVRARTASAKAAKDTPLAEEKSENLEGPFLQGAAIAFRKIVEAYGAGDTSTLKKLLEGPLLETFEEMIQKRKRAKETLEVDISRITKTEVLDKREEKGKAYITVRFESEQCLVTRDNKGKILHGDPDRYSDVTDIWTFARPVKSTDPNWKLVATQVPEA